MEENFIKIIRAAYTLLEFFPDNDPLKYKAKEKALEVLQNVTLIHDVDGWSSLKKEKASGDLFDDIEILKSYLKLGKYQGWIGGMNFLILLKELDSLKLYIKLPRGSLKSRLELQNNRGSSIESGQNLEIAAKTDQPNLVENVPVIVEKKKETSKPELLNVKNIVDERIFLQPPLPKTSDENAKNAIRREKILGIINTRGSAQVSDIIKEIPNVTKRTIRRDLDELLKKSKIVRNGEWNKIFYQMS